MALGFNASNMKQQVGSSATMGSAAALFACSIIVMTAISFHGIKKGDSNFAELIYGLLVTIVTILGMGAVLKGIEATTNQAAQLYAMALMAILWSVAAGLLTFGAKSGSQVRAIRDASAGRADHRA